MQSKDEHDEIVNTAIVASKEEMIGEFEKAIVKGAVSHVIAQMPKRGEIITIRGLEFIVKSSGSKGSLHLKLREPTI